MGSVQKICCACNTDVANKKRVKDTQGNYYCQPCYEAKRADKHVGVAAGAGSARAVEKAPAAAPVVDPYDFPPAESGDIGFAEDLNAPAEPASPDLFGCADCKKLVPSKQIRNDDGDFVCHLCFAKRRKPPGSGSSMPRPAAREDAAEKAPGFGDSLLGGFAFTLASLAAVFAIVFGMQFAMALPQPVDGGKTLADTSTAVGVGILYTFYHLGFAMIIWLGVLIAVKATGGRATFGAMLWKCFALCGAVTIFFRITDQWFLGTIFGIIPGVFFALRYTAVGAGVSSMFELENGPRRLVVAVGMLLTELFGFTFYIVFGVLIGLQVIHVEKPPRDPENDARIQQFQEEMRQALDKAKAEHATGQPAATPAPDAAPAANPPAAPAQ